jgi:nicotinamide riboside kinase
MDPDVPYEEDPQRYIPDFAERVKFHEKLLKELQSRDVPFVVIAGNLQERTQKCIEEIDKLLLAKRGGN